VLNKDNNKLRMDAHLY